MKAPLMLSCLAWRTALFAAAFLLFGCKDDRARPPQPGTATTAAAPASAVGGSVTILVAASAKDVIAEIAASFTASGGGEVKIVPGASNALANQILHDAPADLFLSASQEWADSVKAGGRVARMRGLLGNGLVLVVPKGNPARVTSPADLGKAAVTRVALAGENVPAGRYAEQTLRAAGLYEGLLRGGKVVRGQDVRVTLSYVERGEVEAGIVYATDARLSRDVHTVFTFDPKTFDRIVYPLVLLKAGEANPAAARFYDYLGSPVAGAVFAKYGFTPAAPAAQ